MCICLSYWQCLTVDCRCTKCAKFFPENMGKAKSQFQWSCIAMMVLVLGMSFLFGDIALLNRLKARFEGSRWTWPSGVFLLVHHHFPYTLWAWKKPLLPQSSYECGLFHQNSRFQKWVYHLTVYLLMQNNYWEAFPREEIPLFHMPFWCLNILILF